MDKTDTHCDTKLSSSLSWQDEGIYEWVDGWPVWYTNWGHNEPSKDEGEGCVAVMSDGSWNDTVCTDARPPICKYTFGKSIFYGRYLAVYSLQSHLMHPPLMTKSNCSVVCTWNSLVERFDHYM